MTQIKFNVIALIANIISFGVGIPRCIHHHFDGVLICAGCALVITIAFLQLPPSKWIWKKQ